MPTVDDAASPRPQFGVIFDVDGVLLDSLPAHLDVCRKRGLEYGLNLSIPDPAAFRSMVRQGVKISPMVDFFRAVGFPSDLAERADYDYQHNFSREYTSPLFPGVSEMLARFKTANWEMGIVTSNTRGNIRESLGSLKTYFRHESIFTREDGISKAVAIECLTDLFYLKPHQVVYIGDQPADAKAALDAGVRFLGVTYGWGIERGDNGMETVGHPKEIADYLLAGFTGGTTPTESSPLSEDAHISSTRTSAKPAPATTRQSRRS
jgi:phosphoglycolate phosphatase